MPSEFSTLTDLALSHGIKHSELIDQIHEAILVEFLKKYPEQAKNASVLVDAQTGKATILSNKKDITPPEFAPHAESIARQVILSHLKKADTSPPPPPAEKIAPQPRILSQHPDSHPGKSVSSWLARLIFWGYNGFFLFMLFIFIWGLFTKDLRTSFLDQLQQISLYQSLLLLVLVATPATSIYLALKNHLSRQPHQLAQLFFFLEVPLIGLTFIFLSFDQAIPIIKLFALLALLIPILFFGYVKQIKVDNLPKTYLLTAIIQILLLIVGYFTLLYSFFSPIFLGYLAKSIFSGIVSDFTDYIFTNFVSISTLWEILYFLIIISLAIFGLIIVTLLIFLPYLLTYLFAKMFLQYRTRLLKYVDEQRTSVFIGLTTLAMLILTIGLSYQADISPYLSQLEQLSTATTFEDKLHIAQQLQPHQSAIKQTLQDMNNYGRRYPFHKNDRYLANAYQSVFRLDQTTANHLQSLFHTLAYPFVYWGPTDSYQLRQNFTYLFGNPDAPTPSQPKPNVELVSRDVQAQTAYQDQLATITVTEEYTNKTYQQQQVIYEFSLPNSAVITDLRLGPNLEFPGVIAPKGAASATYERELQRRRDPALLEQVGPRQYRLRVFPIPAKNDRTTLQGKNQKVQFTYIVNATSQGYTLPNYSKTQNINPDPADYTVSLNHQSVSAFISDAYIRDPQTNGPSTDPCQVTQTQTTKTLLENISVSLVPHSSQSQLTNNFDCQEDEALKFPSLLTNQRIALLYDVSRGNKNAEEYELFFKALDAHTQLLTQNTFDLYLFNDQLSQPIKLTNSNLTTTTSGPNLVYFGTSDLNKALKEFSGVYDLAIIITNQTTAFANLNLPSQFNFPIYLIHTDIIPPYNQTFTNYLIQHQGYVANNLSDALDHFVLTQNLQPSNTQVLTVSPYWSLTVPANSLPAITKLPEFTITQTPLPSPTPRINNNLVCGTYFRRKTSNTMVQGNWTDDPQYTISKQKCQEYMQTKFLNKLYCDMYDASVVSVYLLNKNRYTSTFPANGFSDNEFVYSQECLTAPLTTPTPTLTPATPKTPPVDSLAAIFNRAYLSDQISQYQGDLTKNLAFLDATNNFALQANLVTPYSSLLALVNETQRNWLQRESQSYNRYEEQPPQPTPVPIFREFESSDVFSPSIGIGNSLFGTSMKSAPAPLMMGGGGGEFGGVSGGGLEIPTTTVQAFSITSVGEFMGGLFIAVNVLLLGGGFLVYLIIHLKNRKKTTAIKQNK